MSLLCISYINIFFKYVFLHLFVAVLPRLTVYMLFNVCEFDLCPAVAFLSSPNSHLCLFSVYFFPSITSLSLYMRAAQWWHKSPSNHRCHLLIGPLKKGTLYKENVRCNNEGKIPDFKVNVLGIIFLAHEVHLGQF